MTYLLFIDFLFISHFDAKNNDVSHFLMIWHKNDDVAKFIIFNVSITINNNSKL
jgi:hypothetical protein